MKTRERLPLRCRSNYRAHRCRDACRQGEHVEFGAWTAAFKELCEVVNDQTIFFIAKERTEHAKAR